MLLPRRLCNCLHVTAGQPGYTPSMAASKGKGYTPAGWPVSAEQQKQQAGGGAGVLLYLNAMSHLAAAPLLCCDSNLLDAPCLQQLHGMAAHPGCSLWRTQLPCLLMHAR